MGDAAGARTLLGVSSWPADPGPAAMGDAVEPGAVDTQVVLIDARPSIRPSDRDRRQSAVSGYNRPQNDTLPLTSDATSHPHTGHHIPPHIGRHMDVTGERNASRP